MKLVGLPEELFIMLLPVSFLKWGRSVDELNQNYNKDREKCEDVTNRSNKTKNYSLIKK